jgi:hypothetical protein
LSSDAASTSSDCSYTRLSPASAATLAGGSFSEPRYSAQPAWKLVSAAEKPAVREPSAASAAPEPFSPKPIASVADWLPGCPSIGTRAPWTTLPASVASYSLNAMSASRSSHGSLSLPL